MNKSLSITIGFLIATSILSQAQTLDIASGVENKHPHQVLMELAVERILYDNSFSLEVETMRNTKEIYISEIHGDFYLRHDYVPGMKIDTLELKDSIEVSGYTSLLISRTDFANRVAPGETDYYLQFGKVETMEDSASVDIGIECVFGKRDKPVINLCGGGNRYTFKKKEDRWIAEKRKVSWQY